MQILDFRLNNCRRANPKSKIENQDVYAPFQIGTKRYAWGIAAGYKNTGLGGGAPDKAEAEVEVYPDGRAEIRTEQRRRWGRT